MAHGGFAVHRQGRISDIVDTHTTGLQICAICRRVLFMVDGRLRTVGAGMAGAKLPRRARGEALCGSSGGGGQVSGGTCTCTRTAQAHSARCISMRVPTGVCVPDQSKRYAGLMRCAFHLDNLCRSEGRFERSTAVPVGSVSSAFPLHAHGPPWPAGPTRPPAGAASGEAGRAQGVRPALVATRRAAGVSRIQSGEPCRNASMSLFACQGVR